MNWERMMRRYSFLLSAILVLIASQKRANGQTILTVPPDSAPFFVGADTVLNLIIGGVLPGGFEAHGDSVVNILDGVVGDGLRAATGSQINQRGGRIGRQFIVFDGAVFRFSGGLIAHQLISRPGSEVHIEGFDFRLNGTPVAGLDQVGASVELNVPANSSLSATLLDGTPFVFETYVFDSFADDSLRLIRSQTPALPEVMEITGPSTLKGIANGQTLNLREGGVLADNFIAGHDSVLNITGGVIGTDLEAARSRISINHGRIQGGQFSGDFRAFAGTIVDISGDAVVDRLAGFDDVIVNVSGGEIGVLSLTGQDSSLRVSQGTMKVLLADGNKLQIEGGKIDKLFIQNAAVASIAGGEFKSPVTIRNGADVTLRGHSFRLSGLPIDSLQHPGDTRVISERGGAILSGIFADGNPFDFQLFSTPGDRGAPPRDLVSGDSVLRLVLVPEPATWPLVAIACGFLLTVQSAGNRRGRRSRSAGNRAVTQ